MIRSFGRYGIVERSLSRPVVARRRPVLFLANTHSCRQHLLFLPAQTRFLSDSRNTPATKADPASTEPAPLPTSPPRKPKVELRPAPVRTIQSKQQTPAPTKPPPESKASSLEQGHSKITPATGEQTKQGKSESIVDITLADMKYAQIHGVLVPPPADASTLGRLWHQAKELFKFYMRGMKLVYTHRVQAHEMLKRVKSGGAPLTRWEARFIARSQSDIRKLVPFVMIVLVIEEIIPLIVLYAPWMLPSTCILPSQRERIEKKRREKQAAIGQVMGKELQGIIESTGHAASLSLRNLTDRTQLIALCGLLSLSTFGPAPIRVRRIERHLKSVAEDDARLTEEGMGARLTEPELFDALEERGIVFVGLEPEEARARLAWWLRSASADASIDDDAISRRVVLVARSGLGQF